MGQLLWLHKTSQEMLKSIIGFRFYCYCHHCWTTSKFCLKIFCCFLLWNSLNKPSTSGRPRLKPQPRKVEEGSASFWVLLCAVFITGFFSPRLSSIPGQQKNKQQRKTFPVFQRLVYSSDAVPHFYCFIYYPVGSDCNKTTWKLNLQPLNFQNHSYD